MFNLKGTFFYTKPTFIYIASVTKKSSQAYAIFTIFDFGITTFVG